MRENMYFFYLFNKILYSFPFSEYFERSYLFNVKEEYFRCLGRVDMRCDVLQDNRQNDIYKLDGKAFNWHFSDLKE